MKGGLVRDPDFVGKFVAVVGGTVVDSDADENILAWRVYGKYGYVPIYVEKIESEEEVLEIPSPELI